MKLLIEIKTRLRGKRRMFFEKIRRDRDDSDASILREMIDFCMKNGFK